MRQTLKNARKPLAETEGSAELHLIIAAADRSVAAGPKVVATLKDNFFRTIKYLNPAILWRDFFKSGISFFEFPTSFIAGYSNSIWLLLRRTLLRSKRYSTESSNANTYFCICYD